ncbi:PAS-domain containing protein [Roseicella aquatilis]|uniref:histidine kinase n=1 Tax=Roseicella aquatilis TaxID=2527868 RepID=A0A4R4DS39_9PROT|nr:PAS-domain containing protein [Roseicella aquatilis]TCZ64368.1 PAS domain-containing protein [Roseicella aquatilis]
MAPTRWMDRAGLACVLVLAALVWLLVGGTIREEFRAAEERAERITATLARTLESEIAGRLRQLDSVLRFGGALYLRGPGNFSVVDWTGIDPDPDILHADILGPDGAARAGAPGMPPLSHPREHPGIAAILADPAAAGLVVGTPRAAPASGRQVIDLARPLHDHDGALAGIAFLSVDSRSFSRLYRRLDLPHGVVGLLGTDGILRAWVPGPETLLGARLPDTVPLPREEAAPEASLRMVSPFDGADRFVTTRRVAGFPLVVMVGWEAEAALAGARVARARLLSLGALLTAMMAGISLMVLHLRRQERRARRQVEAALAHLEQGVLMVDPAGRVAVVNGRAQELLGLPPGLAVPGRRVEEVIEWQVANGEFGGGPAPRIHVASLGGPGSDPIVTQRTRPNGRILEVRTAHAGDGSHVRTFTDVTEQRRGAEAIAAARDRALAAEAALAAALENVPHGVLLVGADHRVQVVNRAATDLMGLTSEEARPGMPVEALIRRQIELGEIDPTSVPVRRTLESTTGGPGEGLSYERPTRDGRMVEVRTTFLPDGRFIRTFTDVTARHAALRSQEAARLAAEAAVRSRTEFLAVVSHELRTPLNAVIGLTDLLLAHGPRPDQVADLRMVNEAGRQLLGLVDDILDVARLERGRVTLREEGFDPRAMLGSLAGLVGPRAQAKGLAFTLQLDPSLPAAARGDQERLRQALLKLLDNAVKFTEAGSITLSARMLAADRSGWRLGISVADTGIGIPPEAQARLFESFAQADSSAARRFGGLGLGLAACRLLVEGMGGSIAVESRAGVGTRFEVEVPLHRTAAGPAPSPVLRPVLAAEGAADRAAPRPAAQPPT